MKKITALFGLIFAGSLLFCFDWPFQKTEEGNFIFHFGQKKGDKISTSLSVENTDEVYCAENGKTLIILENSTEDTDFFPSALGTCVILTHKDNLISVYSNLDKNKIQFKDFKSNIEKGNLIANTGKSGFHYNEKAIDFQIIDTIEKKAINPELLLPQKYQFPALVFSTTTMKNKNGTVYDLQYAKNFTAGTYKIYQKIVPENVIYKSTILANGEVEDQIIYDTIIQSSAMKKIAGAKHFESSDIFPDNKTVLLGEINLKPGKIVLTVQISDIKGNTKQQNYNITVY